MTAEPSVGRRVPRREARSRVVGSVRYVADLRVPSTLHGCLVRSQYPHAIIRDIDASAALEVQGVVRVVWAADVEAAWPAMRPFDPACGKIERDPANPNLPGDLRLFDRHVRFAGEPVALVLAETDEAARAGAERVEVDYEPQPPVIDPEAAMRPGAPVIHHGAEGNLSHRLERSAGDVDAAFARAHLVVERTFQTSRQKQAQLEPTGCLVTPEPDGRVTVVTPHQGPHRARAVLAELFGLPLNAVRVVVPPIGGAFGKADGLAPEPYAMAGALLNGRPVRLVFTRQEDFVGTESRHATRTHLAGAFRADGTLIALRGRTIVDAGAYLSHSLNITGVLLGQFLSPYRLEAAHLTADVVFTTTPTSGAFRGYGGPQAAFPLEHLVDLACRELGVDPLEARRRMRTRRGDPWGFKATPLETDVFGTVLDEGARAFGWDAARAATAASGGATERTDTRRRGVGMACVVWKSGVYGKGLDHSGAEVRWLPDGTVHVSSAAIDLGTGIRTTLAQICADSLGVPLETVHLGPTDTDVTPYESGAFASRSLYRNGQAVEVAARQLRAQLVEFAAGLLEIDPRDLDLRDGAVVARDAPERRLALPTVLRKALHAGREFHAHGTAPPVNTPSFSAQFAEVEVDTETGEVSVRRVLAVQDVGRAINPTIVEGQIQGAVHQGLGYALSETLVIDDETGTLVNGTFMDYRVLTSADSPPIYVLLIEEPDPTGPFGAKGIGEPSIVITAPAVANAILDAIGTAPTRLPMTPERVLDALDAAREAGEASTAAPSPTPA
jgi:xanthine dehydrogenase molybdenum-binding subunit